MPKCKADSSIVDGLSPSSHFELLSNLTVFFLIDDVVSRNIAKPTTPIYKIVHQVYIRVYIKEHTRTRCSRFGFCIRIHTAGFLCKALAAVVVIRLCWWIVYLFLAIYHPCWLPCRILVVDVAHSASYTDATQTLRAVELVVSLFTIEYVLNVSQGQPNANISSSDGLPECCVYICLCVCTPRRYTSNHPLQHNFDNFLGYQA